jgi:hypothetical protein
MIFHFIAGRTQDAAAYASMQAGVNEPWFLGATKATVFVYPCGSTQDPYSVLVGAPANGAAAIMAAQPTGDIYLIGFSFGGYQAWAIALASLLSAGRNVHLMLLDPVNWTRNNSAVGSGNDAVETITVPAGATGRLVEVVNVHRVTTGPGSTGPWSAQSFAVPAGVPYQGVEYWNGIAPPPQGDIGHHGDQVANCPATQAFLASAASTGYFLPQETNQMQVTPSNPSVVAGSPITLVVSGAPVGAAYNWQFYQNRKWSSAECWSPTFIFVPALSANGILVGCNLTVGGQMTPATPATLTVTASAPPPAPAADPIVSVTVTRASGKTTTIPA